MRINGGRYRGRPLVAPPGAAVRPTSDRARQAVFNLLLHAAWADGVEGARAIDLFAGTGAMGLEALSNGAAFALFVETDEQARGAIRRNLEGLGLIGHGRIHRRDAAALGEKPASDGAPFDLAFLDPPYGQGLGGRALSSLARGGWLRPGAICVVEQGADEPAPAIAGYEPLDERRYGAARIHILRASPGAV